MESLGAEMVKARHVFGPTDVEVKHRRGAYYAVNTGISLGGGSKASPLPLTFWTLLTPAQRPGELGIRGVAKKKATMNLRCHEAMGRLAGYTTSEPSLPSSI
jgi:hypothetical protein